MPLITLFFFTEKFTYYKTVEDAVSIKPKNLTETEEWIISPRGPKKFVRLQDSEASGTSSSLQLKPLRVSYTFVTILQILVGSLD